MGCGAMNPEDTNHVNLQQPTQNPNLERNQNFKLPFSNSNRILVLNNDISVRPQSFSLVSSENHNYSNLKFTYDTLNPCKITIWPMVTETFNSGSLIITNLTCAKPKLMKEEQIQNKGKGITFTGGQINWDIIVGVITAATAVKKVFYYLQVNEPNQVKLIKQKLELEDQSYEVKEIYGISSSAMVNQPAQQADAEKECVVCYSEKIDTVIMPCRHMCLCIACAKSLQESKKLEAKKCPICRKPIESFLRLKNQSQNENSSTSLVQPSKVFYNNNANKSQKPQRKY